jgi:protein TonB
MRLLRHLLRIAGGFLLTLLFFLVLPLFETIGKPAAGDTLVRSVDVASIPPPPAVEEKPKDDDKPPEEPPELDEAAAPLDLSQLELALGPSLSGDWLAGDFVVKLPGPATGGAAAVDALFSLADLDQKPRAIYQPPPILTSQLRQKAPGTVQVLFIVDEHGAVESPIVQAASDPAFGAPALAAVKQWRFEPGKRNGQAVRFRMRVPITFPKVPSP